jgi:hypothetical protein
MITIWKDVWDLFQGTIYAHKWKDRKSTRNIHQNSHLPSWNLTRHSKYNDMLPLSWPAEYTILSVHQVQHHPP